MEVRSQDTVLGSERMTLDWVPGAAIAVAGSLLSFWKNGAVMEERLKGYKEELDDVKKDQREFQTEVNTSLTESLQKMGGLLTEVKVLASEQTAFNRIATKTMEGMMHKLETHDEKLAAHDVKLAVLAEDKN